jgi:hypothetical protein
MADFNPLAASRYAELVRRVLGEDLVVSTVSPELTLSLVLALDRLEWLYPAQEMAWAAGIFRAANVANPPLLRVANPLGSTMIEVVDALVLSTLGGSIRLQVGPTTTIADLGTVVTGIPRDTRWGTKFARVRLTSADAASTFVNVWYDQLHNTAAVIVVPLGIVLGPGTAFEVATPSVNNVLGCSVFGRERGIRPEEASAS